MSISVVVFSFISENKEYIIPYDKVMEIDSCLSGHLRFSSKDKDKDKDKDKYVIDMDQYSLKYDQFYLINKLLMYRESITDKDIYEYRNILDYLSFDVIDLLHTTTPHKIIKQLDQIETNDFLIYSTEERYEFMLNILKERKRLDYLPFTLIYSECYNLRYSCMDKKLNIKAIMLGETRRLYSYYHNFGLYVTIEEIIKTVKKIDIETEYESEIEIAIKKLGYTSPLISQFISNVLSHTCCYQSGNLPTQKCTAFQAFTSGIMNSTKNIHRNELIYFDESTKKLELSLSNLDSYTMLLKDSKLVQKIQDIISDANINFPTYKMSIKICNDSIESTNYIKYIVVNGFLKLKT